MPVKSKRSFFPITQTWKPGFPRQRANISSFLSFLSGPEKPLIAVSRGALCRVTGARARLPAGHRASKVRCCLALGPRMQATNWPCPGPKAYVLSCQPLPKSFPHATLVSGLQLRPCKQPPHLQDGGFPLYLLSCGPTAGTPSNAHLACQAAPGSLGILTLFCASAHPP